MTDLERALRVIDESDCEHRSHIVMPWIAKAADRIAELEAALKPFSDAVYNDSGDVTIVHPGAGDYMRAKRVLGKAET